MRFCGHGGQGDYSVVGAYATEREARTVIQTKHSAKSCCIDSQERRSASGL
jgi:hypothetical protein